MTAPPLALLLALLPSAASASPACASEAECEAAAASLRQEMAPYVRPWDPETLSEVGPPPQQKPTVDQMNSFISRYNDIRSAWGAVSDKNPSELGEFVHRTEPGVTDFLTMRQDPGAAGQRSSAVLSQGSEMNSETEGSTPQAGSQQTAPAGPNGVTAVAPPPDPKLIAQTQQQESGLQASGLSPQRADPLVANYLKGGSPQDAARLASEVLRTAPDDAQALSMRAQARLQTGDADGAYADAKQALALNPDDVVARIMVGHREELGAAAGRINVRPGFEAAADAGALAAPASAGTPAAGVARSAAPAELFSSDPGTLTGTAREHFQEARDALEIGDSTKALLEATAAIDAAPRKAAPYVLRAEISNRLGNFRAALEDARRALALEPRNAAALRELAYAELKTGDFQSAFQHADAAVSLDPTNGAGYLYRAMAEEKLGKTAEALADYAKAEQLEPALAPVADAALARLRGEAPAPVFPAWAKRRAFRGGAIALSMLLIVLGLAGTATGRRAVTTVRGLWRKAPPESGELLAGNYRLVRELGRGGMGVVYEGVDEALRRPVAVKRLHREAGLGKEELSLLLQEARIVAQLKHPRIAEIYNVLMDGDVFLVFEYIEGAPLDRALAKRTRFQPAEALRAVEDIAAAMDYAHAQNVIHRDLKPSNVMLEGSGSCKVMDFGIAHRSKKAAALTVTAASGTPDYMSPEQLMGSVSKASDLYALAVMTYELLAGRRPFPGPDFLPQKLQRRFEPPSAVGLAASLDGFFSRALDPDPARRPADGASFAADFKESLGALLQS